MTCSFSSFMSPFRNKQQQEEFPSSFDLHCFCIFRITFCSILTRAKNLKIEVFLSVFCKFDIVPVEAIRLVKPNQSPLLAHLPVASALTPQDQGLQGSAAGDSCQSANSPAHSSFQLSSDIFMSNFLSSF